MSDFESAAAHFNAEVERNGSGQFCDPANAFLLPECRALAALWIGAAPAGGLARRDAMTARRLKPYLARLILVEQTLQTPPRLRFRLVGTLITPTLSERTGKYFDDPSASPEQTARWTATTLLALKARRPLRFVMRGQNAVTGEMVCLPLADENGRERFVLAYGCYDPLRDWTVREGPEVARISSMPQESLSLAG
jgi:hypothetical protein